jgi:predicted small integral membrane protein
MPGHDVWGTTATAFRWVESANVEAGLLLEISMIALRAAKAATVAAIALFASLVTFGNLTDYNTNYVFVEHVLSMDTIYAFSTIKYRAITDPALAQAAYALIIATQAVTAVLCWIGALALARRLSADAAAFNRAKTLAVVGLTLGFLLWHVGFMSIGGEWFGMWQSQQWNGVPSAFRFVMTIIAVLIFVAIPDQELERGGTA